MWLREAIKEEEVKRKELGRNDMFQYCDDKLSYTNQIEMIFD